MPNKERRIALICMMFLIIGALITVLTGCSSSDKIPIPTVKDGVYVYDEGNIIDDDVESQINDMLVDLEEKTEAEFAVITVDSLQGREIEDYANNLFNTMGIGKKDKDNGLLLLISKSDEKVRIEVGRGLEGCLNDSKCGRILDDYFVPYRESDKYSEGTKLTVEALLSVLADEYNVQIEGVDEALQVQEYHEIEFLPLIAIIAVAIIVLVIIIIWSYSDYDSDDDDYYTGGFFGGGRSFSGGSFGGGFSGGGGASR